jgi:D-arabinose 1-dehydrogenase-like Zn-dependent alcohol dehydrogenase
VAHVCKDDIPEALQLLKSGKVAKLLTDRIVPLEEANKAFEDLSTGKANGKILIKANND